MTKIEWTHVPDGQGGFKKKGETWNPQVGCVEVSPACRHCYAASTAHLHAKTVPQHAGLTVVRSNGVHWNGEINRVPKLLEKPLRWREPRGIFVGSMTDTFLLVDTEEDCEFIAALFGVMAATPQHTYMLLTKRPENAAKWFAWLGAQCEEACVDPVEWCVQAAGEALLDADLGDAAELLWDRHGWARDGDYYGGFEAMEHADVPRIERRKRKAQRDTDGWDTEAWPLPNVWLGVTAEDQQRADERIPALLGLPAAVRFVSYEPACGPVDFSILPANTRALDGSSPPWDYFDALTGQGVDSQSDVRSERIYPSLDWIIAGGESGHGARPAHPAWVRSARDQCVAAGVSFFFKQWGEWAPHGDGWTHVVFPDGKLDTWEAAYSETAAEDRGMLEATLTDSDGAMIKRVGKATAGRELDGETWSQFPTDARP